MDSPLRLIASNPVDRLARTFEALLVVASAPLSVGELADATDDDPERVQTALSLLRERYSEGRSGIVLERVSGGYAFRAAREAAEACGRLFERPVEDAGALDVGWHLLTHDRDYDDLGGDYFTRRNTDRQRDRLIKQLTGLGYYVTLDKIA